MAAINLANIDLCPGGNTETEVDVEFTENNVYSVYPSDGYDAMEKVNVTVNIPEEELYYIYADIPEDSPEGKLNLVKIIKYLNDNITVKSARDFVLQIYKIYKGDTLLIGVITKQHPNFDSILDIVKDSEAENGILYANTAPAKDLVQTQYLTELDSITNLLVLKAKDKINDNFTVNIPADTCGVIGIDTTNIEETKTVTILENGTYNVLPTNGLLKQVTVNVNTPQLDTAIIEVLAISRKTNDNGEFEWEIKFTGGEETVLLDVSSLYDMLTDAQPDLENCEYYDFPVTADITDFLVILDSEFTIYFPFHDTETGVPGAFSWRYPGSGNKIYGRPLLA